MRKSDQEPRFLLFSQNLLFFGGVCLVTSWLFWNQLFSTGESGQYLFKSDMKPHLSWCNDIASLLSFGHFGFHGLVWGLSVLTGLSSGYIFVSLLAVATTANALLIYVILKKLLENCTFSNWHLLLSVFVLMTIEPLYMPGFSIYLSAGSTNAWHNPTLIAVKPFSLAIVFMTVGFAQTHNTKFTSYVVVTILTLLSSLIKPSFVLIFLPALWLFLLISVRTKPFFFFVLLLSILSVGLLALQQKLTYGQDLNSKIIIDFFGVWSLYSHNIPLSIVRSIAFPLALILMRPTLLTNNNYMIFAVLLVFFGTFYYAFFAEAGPRYSGGNFGWFQDIALQVLFVFSMAEFLRLEAEGMRRYCQIMLFGLLARQLLMGIFYDWTLWTDGDVGT